MDINKRDRSVLKSYFVEHALPTEDNFAELIDGMVNQKDDGIVKQPGSPLSLEASGDETSYKKALHLYDSFTDTHPSWTLSLQPRTNPKDPASSKRGLSIGTSSGVSRLFIDHASGHVGVGTVEPESRLHVAGDSRVDGALHVGGRVGVGTAAPEAELHVAGAILCDGELQADRFTPSTPLRWTDAVLQNGFVPSQGGNAHDQPSYCKDIAGCVHVKGTVKRTRGSGPVVIFTLPEGFRPPCRQLFYAVAGGGVRGAVHVSPNGAVHAIHYHNSYLSLDSIHFMALLHT